MSINTITRFSRRQRRGTLFALGVLLTGATYPANASTYSLVGLSGGRPGSLGGGFWDDKGYKVGAITTGYDANNNPITQATIWNPFDASDPLTTFGTVSNSVANAANAVGGVAGAAADDPDGELCPVWWHLPFPPPHGGGSVGDPVYYPLPSGFQGQGLAINNSFQMVGWQQVASPTLPLPPPRHAFLYDPEGGRVDLGTLGGDESVATGINNVNQIVGWAALNPQPLPPQQHAFLYSPASGMHDLGTLGGDNSQADFIDEDGWVGGSSEKYNPAHPEWHFAFIYTPAAGMRELPLPSGQVQGEAVAINQAKWIVGRTWDAAGNRHPVVWKPVASASQYEPTDPNIYLAPDSGWVLKELVGINDSGQLIGNGTNKGNIQGFVLTPASAPGTLAGRINFQSYVGTASQTVTFQFRPVNNDPTFNVQASVGPDGSFQLGGLPTEPYTLHVKSANYLAQNMLVDLTGGAVSGVNILQIAGDANNDNAVDIADFGLLVSAYGGNINSAGSGYAPNADFNGDGANDISDFSILVNNYGLNGDP